MAGKNFSCRNQRHFGRRSWPSASVPSFGLFYFADSSNVDWFDTVLVALPHRIRNLAKRIHWHLKPPITIRGILPLHKLLELLLERIVFLLFGLDRYVVYLYGVLR